MGLPHTQAEQFSNVSNISNGGSRLFSTANIIIFFYIRIILLIFLSSAF